MPSNGTITFHTLPVPKPRMTRADRWKKRPCVLRYYAFRDYIHKILTESGFRPGDAFRMDFYIPMPKSWSKKKKEEMKGNPHQQKPDIDNYEKGLLDALFTDDSKVWKVHKTKTWAENPAIVLENLD